LDSTGKSAKAQFQAPIQFSKTTTEASSIPGCNGSYFALYSPHCQVKNVKNVTPKAMNRSTRQEWRDLSVSIAGGRAEIQGGAAAGGVSALRGQAEKKLASGK
jgi:hypothetical protein